jgi:8-oxo-dGTP pyrophosphatase MutT (NUDIX family)
MYRIFINESVLILASFESDFDTIEVAECQDYSGISSLDDALSKLQKQAVTSLLLRTKELSSLWSDFRARYKLIDAAGGVLVNSKSEVLWMRRNDCWDLPKGKVELGETTEVAAVREVEEECSVHGIVRGALLGLTYHTYPYKGEEVLKTSYWYAMSCEGKQSLKPQIEEGITEVLWVNKETHLEYMKHTYPSITELLMREKVQRFLGF